LATPWKFLHLLRDFLDTAGISRGKDVDFKSLSAILACLRHLDEVFTQLAQTLIWLLGMRNQRDIQFQQFLVTALDARPLMPEE
jgi:hypothetical protein